MKLKTKPIETSARGYYSLEVRKADGSLVEDKCSKTPTQNVVTYAGAYNVLFGIPSSSGDISYIYEDCYSKVGTGSLEITRSSADLNAPLAQKSDELVDTARGANEVDNLDGTSTITAARTFTFPLGSITGTISEVGVYTRVGDVFVAGQLIKDELGDPTTITVLSDEQLTVNYTLEWTVPNESQLVGSGTVDADGTSTNYEVWAQPYHNDYTIAANSGACRYASDSFNDEFALRGSDGTTIVYNTGDQGSSWTHSHDGSGTVTMTSSSVTFSPGDFSTTDLAFFGAHTSTSISTDQHVVDTTNVLGDVDGDCAAYVKFSPAITKTSEQSLTIQVELTLTV